MHRTCKLAGSPWHFRSSKIAAVLSAWQADDFSSAGNRVYPSMPMSQDTIASCGATRFPRISFRSPRLIHAHKC